ncbi:hypothetical protein [Clostridium weizhouense]|uniref:Uncharacterized protein n=1 Tax=Clostridium weizhouense TaxID=2859781 RepID=A0ABS7APU4_9CLOT|nr:hypothetical protein [Clostridium weizhouense]MBW6410569.1 hypothetical protein [Clostridium weizhouense]
MVNEKYDYYFIKQKDDTLLKFSYDSQKGIYYQIFMKQNWSDKKSIYKESFKCFYVLEGCNGEINVFCQDICGDIILCTLEGIKWNYKTLLHMKYDSIMPVYIRAFFHLDHIHLLYNIIDKHTYSEVLVQQITENGVNLGSPQIINKLDYYNKSPYCINRDFKSNLVLLNTMLVGGYQLTSRKFHIIEGRWGKKEVIYTSFLPYIDFNFCLEENRSHYLFITQDDQINRVIYQYKEIGLQKNIILFQSEKIDSCLLILLKNVLWALWICSNNLYGCFSKNHGQNFSSPKIYKSFDKGVPIKVFFQEHLEDQANKHYCYEIYVISINGEEQMFLHELLENSMSTQEDNKGYLKAVEDSDCKMEGLKDCLTKVKILEMEKEESEAKLKIAEEELKRLNEAMKYEKNQVIKFQYQFYKEKEKIKLYTNENDRLKEKNKYLENKLLLKDKEKIFIEEKLAEKEKENESLKKQINFIEIQKLCNSEKIINESDNGSSKEKKFSLVKWLFED